MIVVDTNIVAYFTLPGTRTKQAEAVRASDNQWHAPELLRYECLNVATHNIRGGQVTRDEAIRVYRRGISLVNFETAVPDPVHIINLHLSSGCTSYDCLFVATAQDLGVKLITTDQEIVRAFPDTAVSIEKF